MVKINTEAALEKPLGRLRALPPSERLVAALDVIEQLRRAQADVAETRRSAVRELRVLGYTLAEIAEMIGTTPTRIHQIEVGYNRQEKASRKRPVKAAETTD